MSTPKTPEKIRALAVWIERPSDPVYDSRGNPVAWRPRVGFAQWLTPDLKIEGVRLEPEDSAPAFELVEHPTLEIRASAEAGAYTTVPRTIRATEITPGQLGGAAPGAIKMNLRKPLNRHGQGTLLGGSDV